MLFNNIFLTINFASGTDRSIIEIDLMGSPPRKEPRLDEEQSVVALEGSMEITRAAEVCHSLSREFVT